MAVERRGSCALRPPTGAVIIGWPRDVSRPCQIDGGGWAGQGWGLAGRTIATPLADTGNEWRRMVLDEPLYVQAVVHEDSAMTSPVMLPLHSRDMRPSAAMTD